MSVIRSQCENENEYLTALRDDFAAAALQGYLAAGNTGGWTQEMQAQRSYLYADAMIKERDK